MGSEPKILDFGYCDEELALTEIIRSASFMVNLQKSVARNVNP